MKCVRKRRCEWYDNVLTADQNRLIQNSNTEYNTEEIARELGVHINRNFLNVVSKRGEEKQVQTYIKEEDEKFLLLL